MNQHPRAKSLGILNGTFSVDGDGDLTCPCADTLFGIVTGHTHMYIAADALNVMNAHGHTPSEMVEIIRELMKERDQYRSAIEKCLNWANGRQYEWGDRAENAFAFLVNAMEIIPTKTEDFA